MRVLIVNTSEKTGGAAVAANRLMDALNNNGVKARMIVRDKETDDITVVEAPHRFWNKRHFLWERFLIWLHLHFNKTHLWDIDIANSGIDISKMREFKEADVIHLAWINQGMLSLRGIRKILNSGKPVVWTMHDLWPATGICHYTRGCHGNHAGCGHCRILPSRGGNDLSARIYRYKERLYRDGNIYFVACSHWLESEAKKSGLFTGQRLTAIPNPIDTHIFRPLNQRESRLRSNLPADKQLILLVSQKVTDERKGAHYFIDAINKLVTAHPEMKETTGVVILGGHSDEIVPQLVLQSYPLGYVNDPIQISYIYNSVDCFVLPSLEDNLPNTIMEAMACGIPCVGFKTGGIPEMISHGQNGYVAAYKDSADLAHGIRYILHDCDHEAFSAHCVHTVTHTWSQHAVAMQYIDIYNQALAFKNYKL